MFLGRVFDRYREGILEQKDGPRKGNAAMIERVMQQSDASCSNGGDSCRRKEEDRMPRASVTLRPDVYETLEHIAREKKVSLAWVIREAAETYIADRWPLFPPQKDTPA